ncbi:hypothetical protein [Streptomyces sp. NPDC050504]|uniref:hypothetical protein n=1 Tax=Streptomyces sp. NPDC050504 TaxID=3365618 RepID=UPI0037AD10D5
MSRSKRTSLRRTRAAWLSVTAAAALTATGLSLPARADDPPPPGAGADSWVQDPLTAEAPPAPAAAFPGPGAKADPAGFTLQAGAMNAETTRRVDRLDAVLPKLGVQNILASANRTARPWCDDPEDPFGSAPRPDVKYCLKEDDAKSREWIPQAVTGVSDARQEEDWGAAKDIQLFASYDGWDPGRDSNDNGKGDCNPDELEKQDACNQKGVRVSFVHTRPNPVTGRVETAYRHVLLAWAYENGADHISFDAVHASEKTLQKGVHAGGMVWYGNFLYLADTRNGIRVFDMRRIMDLDPDGDPATHDAVGADTDGVKTKANTEDKTKVGRHDNVWYSFGYRYVMPQVAAWKFKAPQQNPSAKDGDKLKYACTDVNAPKASYLSLDRSTEPDRLVMGEYCRPYGDYKSTGRVASYKVADLEARSGEAKAQGWANFLPRPGLQGLAVSGGKFYYNESRGVAKNGYLWRAHLDDSGRLVENPKPIETATGPEDLYIERGADRLWSVSEHSKYAVNANDPVNTPCGSLCARVLYAHKLSWVDAQ